MNGNKVTHHACREGCAACCIAVSISSKTPKHPKGKPAGQCCKHLTEDFFCDLFGLPERPQVCADFMFTESTCGSHRGEAMDNLAKLEEETS